MWVVRAAQAFLLTNAHTIVLLVRSAAALVHVAPLKLIGTLVTMAGAWMTCLDIYGPGAVRFLPTAVVPA